MTVDIVNGFPEIGSRLTSTLSVKLTRVSCRKDLQTTFETRRTLTVRALGTNYETGLIG